LLRLGRGRRRTPVACAHHHLDPPSSPCSPGASPTGRRLVPTPSAPTAPVAVPLLRRRTCSARPWLWGRTPRQPSPTDESCAAMES
jgi:hypothetical protein